MKLNDEYNWPLYPKEYAAQLQELREKDGLDFFAKKYEVIRDLIFHDKLHGNWKELYSTVYRLNPRTIFEVGCGGCYHIKNIHTFLPDAIIGGADLLQDQIDFGINFSNLPNFISGNIRQMDFSKEIILADSECEEYEFVYSHAVIMHMSTEHAITCLRNMHKISSKYIFLIEGVANHHNWKDLVSETMPEYDLVMGGKYIENAILLTKKQQEEESQ